MTLIQGGTKAYVEATGSKQVGRLTWARLGKSNLQVISAYRVGKGNDAATTPTQPPSCQNTTKSF